MWQRFKDVFAELLYKATQPIQQPTPVVPANKPEISAADRKNHEEKIHYKKPHEANTVVQRTYFQDPKKHKGIHYYSCPVCEHEHGKKQYILGHSKHEGISQIPGQA